MTLEQLRVFVAVAERQHVTRAAAMLNLAQSAVSAAITALEARHGTKLFHRVGRGVELTEAGALFLSEPPATRTRVGAWGCCRSRFHRGDERRSDACEGARRTRPDGDCRRH